MSNDSYEWENWPVHDNGSKWDDPPRRHRPEEPHTHISFYRPIGPGLTCRNPWPPTGITLEQDTLCINCRRQLTDHTIRAILRMVWRRWRMYRLLGGRR